MVDAELAARLPIGPGMLISGKYRFEEWLAAGGMGAVALAKHEILGQKVAIKMMLPELVANKEAAQRFLQEARASAKLQSDYIGEEFSRGK